MTARGAGELIKYQESTSGAMRWEYYKNFIKNLNDDLQLPAVIEIFVAMIRLKALFIEKSVCSSSHQLQESTDWNFSKTKTSQFLNSILDDYRSTWKSRSASKTKNLAIQSLQHMVSVFILDWRKHRRNILLSTNRNIFQCRRQNIKYWSNGAGYSDSHIHSANFRIIHIGSSSAEKLSERLFWSETRLVRESTDKITVRRRFLKCYVYSNQVKRHKLASIHQIGGCCRVTASFKAFWAFKARLKKIKLLIV